MSRIVSRVEVEVKWVGRRKEGDLTQRSQRKSREFAENKRLLEARSLEKFGHKAHSQEWLCHKA
jgi:hypothetical protein